MINEPINYEVNFKEISARIKQLRINAGYTQESFSEMIGFSPSYAYQIEAGLRKLSVSALTKISLLFDVSLDFLIMGNTKTLRSDKLETLITTFTDKQRDDLYTALNSIIEPLSD